MHDANGHKVDVLIAVSTVEPSHRIAPRNDGWPSQPMRRTVYKCGYCNRCRFRPNTSPPLKNQRGAERRSFGLICRITPLHKIPLPPPCTSLQKGLYCNYNVTSVTCTFKAITLLSRHGILECKHCRRFNQLPQMNERTT